MKKQINFCVVVLIIFFVCLILFLMDIKTLSIKNLWMANLLLSATLFSLFIVIFGIIIYTKNIFLKTLDADTSVQEDFLRISAISSLPEEVLERISPGKMKEIITGGEKTEKETSDEILKKASRLFSENLI